MPYWCRPHHVTYETLPIPAVLGDGLGILRQFEWSLASGFIFGGRPPLQRILMICGC